MAELLAQGPNAKDRWKRTLPANERVVLGRQGTWPVPWDARISRHHAELYYKDGYVLVSKLPEGRNPIYWKGGTPAHFELHPGDHFVIGETTFTLVNVTAEASIDIPSPVEEQTFTAEYLKQLKYRNAEQRIEILVRLPELISAALTDAELFQRLVDLLLIGIPRASTVGVVEAVGGDSGKLEVIHWDRRRHSDEPFHPSERLLREALNRGASVLHVWHGSQAAATFTLSVDCDWSFCCPIRGASGSRIAIYVAGRFRPQFQDGGADLHLAATPTEPNDLRDDLKFTESMAATIAALRDARVLQQRQANLAQFFSPVVLDALGSEDPVEVLSPRETQVSVLFCDLRGFSRQSEAHSGNLLGLLERVSRALGVTTRHILAKGGVVGDFHGDAAMGFWGWPLAQKDSAARACSAALAIRDEFEAAANCSDDPLSGFRMGLGIATGRAVAGKIGTVDQVKVTVFGPVVNLASRLEGMTKILRASILLDEETVQAAKAILSPEEARFRKLAVVRPSGMDTSLLVTELMPSAADIPWMKDEHITFYEMALEKWRQGSWDDAFNLLHKVPAKDRAKDFLTVFIAQHNRTPPPQWDGAIHLQSKG